MKNSTLILLAAVSLVVSSCFERGRSSSTFALGTNFEMNDYDIEKYTKDSIMYAPEFSWDNVTTFKAQVAELNQGYQGGLVFSTKKGSSDDPELMRLFSSGDPGAGAMDSKCYMAFYQTAAMPDYDIVYDFSSYYSASASIMGFYICNTKYTAMLIEEGKIAPGDFLKVKVEFFNSGASVGSAEKYLVDYTGSKLESVDEWYAWDIAKELQENKGSIGNFNQVKFHVESSSSEIQPSFCLDNYMIQLSVEY